MVVLGGELSMAQQHLLLPIQQHLNRYALPQLLKDCKISMSALGANASLLGNMALVLDHNLKT
jgi:predicted NBD/HSP70 family sugar kinase